MAGTPGGSAGERVRRFDRELERVRLRALLAVELAGGAGEQGIKDHLRGELERLEAELLPLRAAGGAAELLGVRLGLEADELDLVWSAVAATADPRLQAHLQLLAGNDGRRGISLATHALLAGLDGPRSRALARALLGTHPLLRHQLLLPSGEGLSPASRPLQAAARLCTWLAGDDRPDDAMQGAGDRLVVPAGRDLDDGQRAAEARMAQVLGSRARALLVVEGPSSTGRRTAVAAAAAEALGRRVVALDLRRVAPRIEALEAALAGLGRECLLAEAVPLVANVDPFTRGFDEVGGLLQALARRLDELPGPVVLTSAQVGLELPLERPVVRIAYGVPEARVRGALWRRALGPDGEGEGGGRLDLDATSMRYRLGPGGIARAVASARLLGGDRPVDGEALVAGVRSYIAERLGDLAQRVEVRQRWEDLVLAPDLLDQARALVARVRHAHKVLEEWGYADKLPRGVGVAALFSGPPGTGKTMLAGLIARDLGLELYQVDLSKVVSKWVGETEKQLSRVFEAADAGHALLLFDEADALFGKRTEVRSAVDRYANLEVNYLLQRIESFGGVTILTTNMDASIDPALRRRLACQITFWPPDIEERTRLWTRLLAARGPVADGLELGKLAERYPDMTGANIRNAVLAAAFLAASEGSAITFALLERAARGEYAAMGRIVRGGAGAR